MSSLAEMMGADIEHVARVRTILYDALRRPDGCINRGDLVLLQAALVSEAARGDGTPVATIMQAISLAVAHLEVDRDRSGAAS